MVAVESLDHALTLLNELQEGTGGAVAAYEYMPKVIYKVTWRYLPLIVSHSKMIMNI